MSTHVSGENIPSTFSISSLGTFSRPNLKAGYVFILVGTFSKKARYTSQILTVLCTNAYVDCTAGGHRCGGRAAGLIMPTILSFVSTGTASHPKSKTKPGDCPSVFIDEGLVGLIRRGAWRIKHEDSCIPC